MSRNGVVVKVPGKVNLQLSVGPLESDGFHEVTTIFQAISIFDDVTVRYGVPNTGITLTVSGPTATGVPTDEKNLAYQAAKLMVMKYGISEDIAIHIRKEIPLRIEVRIPVGLVVGLVPDHRGFDHASSPLAGIAG